MLEVINGALMVYFILLCAINVLVPHLIKPIAACFSRPSNEERIIWTEIMKLKSEQSEMSMKEEFAAYSKLQRQINKYEGQLKEDSQARSSKSLAIKSSIQLGLQGATALVMVLSVIWFRREPIVALNTNLFPFSTVLSYPSSTPNSISTHVWVLISNLSMRTLLKPILS